jgi:hypothetical protein
MDDNKPYKKPLFMELGKGPTHEAMLLYKRIPPRIGFPDTLNLCVLFAVLRKTLRDFFDFILYLFFIFKPYYKLDSVFIV